MIKKFFEFINESNKPKPDSEGCKRVSLTPEEESMFSSEPSLQKLIVDEKVTLLKGEVWFHESDEDTHRVLDQYLEMPGKI